MNDARAITKTLGGMWCGTYGLVRCPAHEDRKPSLSIRDGEQELIVNCFAGCDWRDVKAKLQRQSLIKGFVPAPARPRRNPPPKRQLEPDADQFARIDAALNLWKHSVPLADTLRWRYFVERRGLHIGLLDLDHALRWHDGINAVAALMTDPVTNEPCGIHRTFLAPDATKIDRKMLGRQGVIRLTPERDVTEGLGIVEGVEDGLSVLLSGWAPVWAATSAGAIERFPVLSGIQSLTIFADTDAVGMRAAQACAARWTDADREVRLSPSGALAHVA
jgi:putative DNA primase/helicase